ncbi:peptidase [candidate division KSB1 bacterium]|nr:peptidase [candidate division KSB1 bacterium]
MISFFRHKGLEKLFIEDDRSKVNQGHVAKLLRILDRLDASTCPQDMNLPGYRLHELKGKYRNHWSVWVTGNWRVIFQFQGQDAINVDLQNYH